MALLAARYIVEGCTIILLRTVLRAMASCTTKAILSDIVTMFNYMVVLIALKALCDITAAIKQLTVIKLAVK
jgi:Holliday junction resolvase